MELTIESMIRVRFMGLILGVQSTRGACIENSYPVSLAMATAELRTLYSHEPETKPYFLRSSAKVLQALPVSQQDAIPLTLAELALACASHGGSPEQIDIVNSLLKKAGTHEGCLICGHELPLHGESRQALGENPTAERRYHNCSGKHAAMLLACRAYGWEQSGYHQLQHPLQQTILSQVKTFSKVEDPYCAIDGCGVPAFALPLTQAAELFWQWGHHQDFNRIREAMLSYPHLVGDSDRIDTRLMQEGRGAILAKVGAEGFLAIVHLPSQTAVALKVEAGLNSIRDRYAVALMKHLDWLPDESLECSNRLQNSLNQETGCYQFILP
jgi:L-asparaginase II